MNNLILIDDRKEFIDAFTLDCAARNYAVYPKRSLAGLKELMPAMHHKAACVILDIKCLHDETQEIEDSSFIGSALSYLDQHFPGFPRLILTGDDKEYDQVRKYHRDEDIYLKTPGDKERLFTRIKYYADKSEELRVRRLNPDAFKVFDNKYLSTEKEKELTELLLALENLNKVNVKDHIAKVRKYLEAIFTLLNRTSSSYMPDEFFTGDKVNQTFAVRYLTGQPVDIKRDGRIFTPTGRITPEHVGFILWMLKDLCSCVGSHEYSHKVSPYALAISVNGLMELLVWLNDFMEKKQSS